MMSAHPETSVSDPTLPARSGASRLLTLLRWLCLGVLIWCAKLWAIRAHGDTLPFGDEWYAEAATLFKPYLEKTLSWSHLFAPLNEHRIFTARLLFLALLKANGLWDPRLHMVVQAMLHSAAIVLFLYLFSRSLTASLKFVFLGATCVLWILPFGWENTLFGFQSQFYFVMLFGLSTLWCLWRQDTLSIGWWAGIGLAIAGLFTMASGFFAPVAGAGLTMIRLWLERAHWRKHLIGLVVLMVLIAVGLALVPHVTAHDPYKARSAKELINAWLSVLSWPQHSPWYCLILQAPFVLLAFHVLRNRTPVSSTAWLILAIGAWGILQSFGLAYGRARLTPLAPRYLDVYVPTLCASFAAFCEWYSIARTRSVHRWTLLLGGAWMICAVQGALSHFSFVTIPELNNWSEVKRSQATLIKQYLETKEPRLLSEGPIANTFPDVLQQMLDDPTIVDILPTVLRPSLGSSRTASENAFFNRSYFETGGEPTPGAQRYWSSFGPEGNTHRGQIELKFSGAKRSRILEFFVAGAPHLEGNSLQIQFKDGAIKDLAPHHGSNANWESVLVRVPPGAFTVVANDDSAQQWLAVSNPREVGLLSHYAEELMGVPEAADGVITVEGIFALALAVWAITMAWKSAEAPKPV